MSTSFFNEVLEQKVCSGESFSELVLRETIETTIIGFLNPFSYALIVSRSDIVNGFDMWFVDGALLCYLRNLGTRDKITRASFDFSSVASLAFDYACRNRKKVALVGATADEMEGAKTNLIAMFPTLDVVYARNGYMEFGAIDSIVKEIDRVGADIVVVGMGCPMQEVFSLACRRLLTTPAIVFTCGGFFTQTASRMDYYHPIVKRFGMRWMQRAIQYPHVRSRLLRDYPRFLLRYIREVLIPLRLRKK